MSYADNLVCLRVERRELSRTLNLTKQERDDFQVQSFSLTNQLADTKKWKRMHVVRELDASSRAKVRKAETRARRDIQTARARVIKTLWI